MAIIKTVSFYDFERAFVDANRGSNFSYEGKKILFDYLENLSADTGEPIELDVISLCCDYTEISLDGIIRDYESLGFSLDDLANDEIGLDEILDELRNHTSVCGSYYCSKLDTTFFVFASF